MKNYLGVLPLPCIGKGGGRTRRGREGRFSFAGVNGKEKPASEAGERKTAKQIRKPATVSRFFFAVSDKKSKGNPQKTTSNMYSIKRKKLYKLNPPYSATCR